MNVPTIEMISDFVKAMPVVPGDGKVVWESGPNPYDSSLFHPPYDRNKGFNRTAYERFEHDRDDWNVLGLVNIEEVIVLKKWFKEEAVLWSVGLCLPQSTKHKSALGPLLFDKETKRRLLNYLERFLRNTDTDELSPAQWIGYAKANGGYEFAQCSMISNPQFVALWDIAESTDSSPSVEQIVGKDAAPPPKNERETGRQESQIQMIVDTAKTLGFNPLDIPVGGKTDIKEYCLEHYDQLFTPSGFGHAWKAANRKNRISLHEKERFLSR